MAPPRKAATYGKSARRPFPDFSAFAEASENNTGYSHQEDKKSKEATTRNGGDRLFRPSESPPKITMTNKARPTTVRGCVDSRTSGPQASADVYEISSTEEMYVREPIAVEAGSRKKRRLTPRDHPSIAPKTSKADEMQQNVVSKPRGQPKTTISVADTDLEDPEPRVKNIPKRSVVSKCENDLGFEVSAPISSIVGGPKSIPLSKANKPQVPTRKKAPSRFQAKEKAFSFLETSSREVSKDQAHLSKPIRLSKTPPKHAILSRPLALDRAENQRLEGEEKSLRSTPPRQLHVAGTVSTPKQQELWHKALAVDIGRTGPKHIELGSHSILREEQIPSILSRQSRLEIDNLDANIRPRKRSVRLIDSLMSSAQDGYVSERDCSEDHESSCAERSKSIQSDVSNNDELPTTQTSPSIDNQSKHHQMQAHAPAAVRQSVPSLKATPKITYIRERTHLGENDHRDATVPDGLFANRTVISGDQPWRATGKLQHEHQALKNDSEGLDGGEDLQGGTMRSIHELREAGGNSRIASELDAILDDLEEFDGSSKATRRTSLLSLASKLLDASTCHMFIDQGLEMRFLAQLNFSHDIFERSFLAACVLQIIFNTTSTVFLSHVNHVRITNLLIGLLDQTQDLLSQVRLRENKISRLAQTEFIAFYDALFRLPVWRASKPPMLSGQILALQCLRLIVLQAREATCRSTILSFDALSRIAETSLPLQGTMQPQSPYSRACLELAVSILESSTKGDASSETDAEWSDTALDRIAGVFPLLTEDFDLENGSLQSLTLRLYLNLTNTSPQLCEVFSTQQTISAVCRIMFLQFNLLSGPEDQRQDLHVLEKLVLSLGYMINLAEFSDRMRLMMMMDIGSTNQKPLETLLHIFQKRKKAAEAYSEVEAENNVAFGYLSVLLSYLCLNRTLRLHVDGRPEGPTVHALLDALEEFLQYHEQIDESTQQSDGGTDRKANFVGRLQVLADELKMSA